MDERLAVARKADGQPDCDSPQTPAQSKPAFALTTNCDGTPKGGSCVQKEALAAKLPVAASRKSETTTMLRCRVTAPGHVLHGVYPVWVSRIGAVDRSGKALEIDGQDGYIHVAVSREP